jgi:hypothetical protein
MFSPETARLLVQQVDGRTMSKRTLLKWIAQGLFSADGGRVRLRATRIGNRYAIRRADLRTFLAAVAGQPVTLADEAEVACA